MTVIISHSACDLCPDRRKKCGTDDTCCKLSSGVYGCCPLPNAECCTDGIHCCPSGTKCNDKEGTCDELPKYIPFSQLVSPNQLCPDRKQQCSSIETCCKQRTGGYGCCPYESGVCCSDGLHCCPHGTKCDVSHRQCIRRNPDNGKSITIDPNDINRTFGGRTSIDKMRKFLKKTVHENHELSLNVTNVICPGGGFQCPDYNTCCKISEEQWGCCPIESAVCCEDKVHCCPPKTVCTARGCQQM